MCRCPLRTPLLLRQALTSHSAALAPHRHPVALVYQVVADVNQYKHFVPWCVDSVVHDGRVNLWQSRPFSFQATLDVGFRLIGERYTSVVSVVPLQRVKVCTANPRWRANAAHSHAPVVLADARCQHPSVRLLNQPVVF